jgi:hypothetical protein
MTAIEPERTLTAGILLGRRGVRWAAGTPAVNKAKLLIVLEQPELPLHTNG